MQHLVSIQKIGVAANKGRFVALHNRHLHNRQIKPAAGVIGGDDMLQGFIRLHAM